MKAQNFHLPLHWRGSKGGSSAEQSIVFNSIYWVRPKSGGFRSSGEVVGTATREIIYVVQ
jgi:hypothetical protein